MSDILCVSARALCKEDFLVRIEKIAAAHPYGIILREKDLSEEEYTQLSKSVMEICERNGTRLILHNFINSAEELGSRAIHLPLPALRMLSEEEKRTFAVLGASCHSVKDALEAERLGCTYITAGHVFETDCKKDLPGRGIEFLREVCDSVSIPVYAIGGISADNIVDVRSAGAKGACVMSGAMTCEEPLKYFRSFNVE